MTDTAANVASALNPKTRQRLFLRYFTAILIDLTVLNLFAEFWDKVLIQSFSYSLLAALILQILLKATLALEHRLARFFKSRPGARMKVLHYASAWFVLFGSKFVILAVIEFALGTAIVFSGIWHGVVTFIVVIVVMLIAEEAIVRFYLWLGKDAGRNAE